MRAQAARAAGSVRQSPRKWNCASGKARCSMSAGGTTWSVMPTCHWVAWVGSLRPYLLGGAGVSPGFSQCLGAAEPGAPVSSAWMFSRSRASIRLRLAR